MKNIVLLCLRYLCLSLLAYRGGYGALLAEVTFREW